MGAEVSAEFFTAKVEWMDGKIKEYTDVTRTAYNEDVIHLYSGTDEHGDDDLKYIVVLRNVRDVSFP